MYIKSLFIDSFAALKEKSIEFSEGLNVIEGANEAGKSTVCMFIKFMFYGLSARGGDGEMTERKKYVPWDTGRAAGQLTVCTANGTFRIERELFVSDDAQARERVEIIDVESGEKVFKGKVPGIALLGVDEKMFVNTVFVRQIGGARIDGSGMTQAIENILMAGDENLNLKKALDKLESARKVLMHKRGTGGAIQLATMEKARLERELSESLQNNEKMIDLENESENLSSLIASRTEESKKHGEVLSAYDKICRMRRAQTAIKKQGELSDLLSELEELEKYGNISEKSGRINALFAKLSGVDSRLRSLRRNLCAPDESLYMSMEDKMAAGIEIASAKKFSKKIGAMAALFSLCYVIGAALVAAGFLLAFELSVAGAVLVAVGVLFTVLFGVNKKKLSVIYEKWAARSIGELTAAVEEKKRVSAAYENDKRAYDMHLGEISLCEKEREDVLSLVRRAAGEFCEENISDTDILVSKALDIAGEITKKKEELNRAIGTLKGELLAFADVCEEKDQSLAIEEAERVLLTKEGKISENMTAAQINEVKNKKNFADSTLPALLRKKGESDSVIAKLRATTKDCAVLAAQIDNAAREISAMQTKLCAVEAARDALVAAGEGMKRSFVPNVLSRAGELMDKFTQGKYADIAVDGEFAAAIRIDDVKREAASLSAGTSDAVYISLRGALAQELFSGDYIPLVFDESFARIDESRLAKILQVLAKSEMQSMVFTCRALEGDIGSKLEGTNYISL